MSDGNQLPPSSYARDGWLIQESLPTAWHLLVAAILLNQSRRTEAWDACLEGLFERWPDAAKLANSDSSLESILKPHGFANVKAKRLRKMSEQYVYWDHKDPRVLYGCGQYAYDSWRIFIKGHRPLPEEVNDGALKGFLIRYHHHGWRIGLPLPLVLRDGSESRQGTRVRTLLPENQTTGSLHKRSYRSCGLESESTRASLVT